MPWILTSAIANLLVLLHILPALWAQAERIPDYHNHDQEQCIQSLLSNRYRMPPTAFNATSEQIDLTGARRYAADSVRAEHADFAWCPVKRVGTELNEFVQADMGELNVITKIVISGLLTEGGGSRFTPHFYIRYKREPDEQTWRIYRQLYPTQTSQLVGSSSPLVPKFVVLDPPLIARWIRIYPYRDPPGFVCVRLEAYGCRFTDDLVEYQIPEGCVVHPPYQAPPTSHSQMLKPPKSAKPVDNRTRYYQAGGGPAFSDVCYDGYRVEPGSLLDGGLGCLTDLGIAPQNTLPRGLITEPAPDSSRHWLVGWHRDRWRTKARTESASEESEDVVDMLFRFATVRSFKRLKLYVSNNYQEKIRLPRRIEVRFSIRGLLFSGQPVISQDYLLDNRTNGVMNIELGLDNRIGRFVQLKVFFADDWLLLSEVKFYSHLSNDQALVDEPVNSRRSKKEPTTSDAFILESAKIPSGLADLSDRHLLIVIVLALVIALFLIVIGLTVMRILWKRARGPPGKQVRQQHSSTERRLDGRNGITSGPNGSLVTVSPTELNRPHNAPKTTYSTFTNRLSGTSAVDDDPSESEPFNKESVGKNSNQFRGGFLHAMSTTFCPKKSKHSRSKPFPSTARNKNSLDTESHPGCKPVNSDFYSHLEAYPTMTYCPENFGNFQNGSSVNAVGQMGQMLPRNMTQMYLSHKTPSVLLNGHAQMNHSLTGQLAPDWLACSGFSNSATNSTGPSLGLNGANPEVNVYTTVGGESDGDSNCTSTMSPEYASTHQVWAATLSHLQQQQFHQNQHLPIQSVFQPNLGMGQMGSLPTRQFLPTAVPFGVLPNTVISAADHQSPLAQTLIYYNPALRGLHQPTTETTLSQFYNPYSQPVNSMSAAVYFPTNLGPVSCGSDPGRANRIGGPTVTVNSELPTCSPLTGQFCHMDSSKMRSQNGTRSEDTTSASSTFPSPDCTRPVQSTRQDQLMTDAGPWIKANRFDTSKILSNNLCPPVLSTPPPPPPPPSSHSSNSVSVVNR
ncbi:hypothetical protein P879_06296 [Paragonimus westermani]|uniref:F5/8 type C domain-containing protein n=1 Tax=Paragonimus westermani TaxID=34504 RepID=A0A8T0D496_9TREM|nr:hypothetical protein P879_06296 [Paragonimus westermani]